MQQVENRCEVLAFALMSLATKLRDPQIGPGLLAVDEELVENFALHVQAILEIIEDEGLPLTPEELEKKLWPDVISE